MPVDAFGEIPPFELSANLVAALSAASTARLSPSGAVFAFGAAADEIARPGAALVGELIAPMLIFDPDVSFVECELLTNTLSAA